MTRYFALTLNAAHVAKPPKTAKLRWPPRLKNPGMFVMAMLFALGVSYLVLVNSVSTKGYEIKKLEQRLVELKETSERLELEARALKAVETIQAEAQALKLVQGGPVNYVSGNDYAFQRPAPLE